MLNNSDNLLIGIIIFVLFIEISSKNPHFDFRPNELSQIITEIKIGSFEKPFVFLVDTNSLYSWVFDSKATSKQALNKTSYNREESTGEVYDCIIEEQQTKGHFSEYYCVNETFYFSDFSVSNVSFVVLKNTIAPIPEIEKVDGVLGLGFSYENDKAGTIKFSILDRMNMLGMIDQKLFTIHFQDEYKGSMHFGEISQEVNDLYSGKLQALKKYDGQWAVQVTRTEIGDVDKNKTITVSNSEDLILDTSLSYSIVSEKFLETLRDRLFTEQFKKSICTMKKEEDFQKIICNDKLDLSDISNIYLIFSDYGMIYTNVDMFYFDDLKNEYTFKIFSQKEVDEWTIGQPILKNFFWVFDKKNEDLIFSSRNFLVNFKSKKVGIFTFVFIVGLVTLTLMIGAYYLFFFIKKKLNLNINFIHQPAQGSEEPKINSLSVSRENLIPKNERGSYLLENSQRDSSSEEKRDI